MANKIVAGLTTAGLLASGGVAAVAVTNPAPALAQEDGAMRSQGPGDARPGGVFADLVDEGVLDETEVAAVTAALRALREAAREEMGLEEGQWRRPRPFRAGFHLHELLEDGVIDATELAGLPEDSPIRDPEGPFAPYLGDGELSAEELEELRAAREADREEREAARAAAVAEVLAGLVADGTLTGDQVDVILAALETAREERPRPIRNGMRAGWQIAEMLEDGVIDAAELAELPEGHPLRDADGPAGDYLVDGQLTRDELQELRSQFGRRGPAPIGDSV